MKKVSALLLVMALCSVFTIGLTMAYLTHRDGEANVFTVGNVYVSLEETFDQYAELMPGMAINKDVSIVNTGTCEAWVWYTYAVPTPLVGFLEPGFRDDTGWAGTDTTDTYTDENGVEYTVFTRLCTDSLAPGAETAQDLDSVTMNKLLDITPAGGWRVVENGRSTDLHWNISDGLPTIFVSAYAIQAAGFDTVQAAYEGYHEQWGKNGTEYATAYVGAGN